MPAHYNDDALNYLEKHANQVDDGASSHWRRMHETFRIENGKMAGMRGFQRLMSPQRGRGWLLHRMMLERYYRCGRQYRAFAEILRHGHVLAQRQNRFLCVELLRQVLTLAFILEHAPNALDRPDNALTIGDGFGVFGALTQLVQPDKRVVGINLRKTLFADLVYYRLVHPQALIAVPTDAASLAEAAANPEVRYLALEADNWPLLANLTLSLATNICSMQEMDPPIVANYFHVMRRQMNLLFYCNNGEVRTMPSGTRSVFDEYPWSDRDVVLADERTPWHQTNYQIRPIPRYWSYKPIRHRLVVLASDGTDAPALASNCEQASG